MDEDEVEEEDDIFNNLEQIWYSWVKITQIPLKIEKEQIVTLEGDQIEMQKTWMYDLFNDNSVYGVEIVCGSYFSMTFFKDEYSQNAAINQGVKLLHLLEFKFPRLAGEVEGLIGDVLKNNNDFALYEIRVPEQSMKDYDFYPILNFIINFFKQVSVEAVKLYIFWQKDDSKDKNYKNGILDIKICDHYKVKLYIKYEFTEGISTKERIRLLKDFNVPLECLTTLLVARLRISGEIFAISNEKWDDICSFNVFWENNFNEETGVRYKYIANTISKDRLPCFLSPNFVDFNFLSSLPIPKSRILEHENIYFLSQESKENDIILGKYISNGLITSKRALISLSSFSQSAVIFGQSGMGKTRLLAYLSREFYEKAPNIGILYLNLRKGNQDCYYSYDMKLQYKDPAFKVPYYVEASSYFRDKYISETVMYLTTCLGLKHPVDKILSNVMWRFVRKYGELPESLECLFYNLLGYYEAYPYGREYQDNIVRAIENRVESLFADKEVVDVSMVSIDYLDTYREANDANIDANVEINKDGGIKGKETEGAELSQNSSLVKLKEKPRLIQSSYFGSIIRRRKGSSPLAWFKKWRSGKKIFIDLSMCNIHVKRFLSCAIFQMIRTLTPNIESNFLENLIIIDEAHQLLEKPIIRDAHDDDCITREELEKIMAIFINEFRGRGLSFIFADQSPHLLFNCVSTQPSLKILFRLSFESSELFTKDKSELDLITFQKNRSALVINSVNSERYMIQTCEHSFFQEKSFEKKREIWYVRLPKKEESMGHEQSNARTCLILKYIKENQLVIVIPFTSTLETNRFPYTLMIKKDAINKLENDSIALVDQLKSISLERFFRKIGDLDKEIFGSIIELIRDLLNI